MKKLVLTFFFGLVSLCEVHAQSSLTTLKVADGSLAKCRTKADFYSARNRSGVYRFRALGAEVENEHVKVLIALEFFKCSRSGESYGFAKIAPYETLRYSHLGFHSTNEVEVIVNEARLKAYKDGDYRILSDQKIEHGAGEVYVLAARIELKDIVNMSTPSFKDYDSSVDFFLAKNLTYNNLTTGDSFRDRISYGSFRVHLKVSRDDKGEIAAYVIR